MYKISDIQAGDYWYNQNFVYYVVDIGNGSFREYKNSSLKVTVIEKKISNNIPGNFVLSLKLEYYNTIEYVAALLNENCRTLKIVENENSKYDKVSFTTNNLCKNNKLRINFLTEGNGAYVADFPFYKKQ